LRGYPGADDYKQTLQLIRLGLQTIEKEHAVKPNACENSVCSTRATNSCDPGRQACRRRRRQEALRRTEDKAGRRCGAEARQHLLGGPAP
jgi:hypothetical protein